MRRSPFTFLAAGRTQDEWMEKQTRSTFGVAVHSTRMGWRRESRWRRRSGTGGEQGWSGGEAMWRAARGDDWAQSAGMGRRTSNSDWSVDASAVLHIECRVSLASKSEKQLRPRADQRAISSTTVDSVKSGRY